MVLHRHRWPVALLIQRLRGLEDRFLADVKAYPAFVNSLAQLVINSQISQLLTPFILSIRASWQNF